MKNLNSGSNGMVGSAETHPLTVRKVLLICGILSSLLWITGDILASIQYEGYSFISQTISELSAIGAPTRSFLIPLGTIMRCFYLHSDWVFW